MSLTRQQQREIDDRLDHAERTLAAHISAMEDLRTLREDLGPEVDQYVTPYFTVTQWQTAYNALNTLHRGLKERLEGARGKGLGELYKEKESDATKK